MKTPKITIVSNGDDWEGLYIDGVLRKDSHSITPRDLANALGLEFEMKEVSPEWLGEEVVGLPSRLDKIPKRAIVS
jgi:hypothetical protein